MKGEGIIGAADTVTKAYIRKNEVFADAFNYFMYDGAQVIQPECLKELDPTEIAILLNEKDTKDKTNKEKEASEQKMKLVVLFLFSNHNHAVSEDFVLVLVAFLKFLDHNT